MSRYKGLEDFIPRKKDPKHQRQGYLNRELGQAFEDQIKIACQYYRRLGIADVEKTPEPFKVTTGRHKNSRDQWVFEGYFESKAQPDFKGLADGGRAIAFDAKATMQDKIEKCEVTDQQAKCLKSYFIMGGWSFVLVSFQRRRVYLVPWPVWDSMETRFGRKYLTERDIEKYRVPETGGVPLIFEFLRKGKEDEA